MVRLKVGCQTTSPTPQWIFQFHYGSVKRVVSNLFMLLRIHFNSTMVRLKVESAIEEGKTSKISIPLWFG